MKPTLALLLLSLSAFAGPPGDLDQVNDSSPPTLSEGDYSSKRITPQRAQHVNLRNQTGTEIGTSTTPVRVDPTGTTAQPATQSGVWSVARTWTLLNSTDSVNAVQSGTWTVQQGATPTGIANAWPFKLTDGTNTAAVKAASTVPVATDPAVVVVQSPNGNHATAANQSTEITALQLIDNPVGSATGGTAGTSSYLAGGVFNTTAPSLTNGQQSSIQLDASGNIKTISIPSDGTKTTYSAAVSGFTPAVAATDVLTIIGSATKTVKVLRVSLSGTTTSGSGITVNLALIKRSTADTAGTSTVLTNVPSDSNDAAGTAVVRNYTANPTLGTAVGNVRTARMDFPAAGLFAASGASSEFVFGLGPEKAIILRGVAEQFVINLGATSITGGVLSAYVEWTED